MRMPETVLVRCESCGVINRLPAVRAVERPRCGKCRQHLVIPLKPVEVTERTFHREVLRWPGAALAVFWSPA